jgi:hypothetical protein
MRSEAQASNWPTLHGKRIADPAAIGQVRIGLNTPAYTSLYGYSSGEIQFG